MDNKDNLGSLANDEKTKTRELASDPFLESLSPKELNEYLNLMTMAEVAYFNAEENR